MTQAADLHAMDASVTIAGQGELASAKLTICVPSYRDDASRLIASLSRLDGAARCALLIYDDGSADPALTARHASALANCAGPWRLLTAHQNAGRSAARNRLVDYARTAWLLLLDADMLPDQADYLTNYLDAVARETGPALISGGFTLEQVEPGADQRLHYEQAKTSDCLSASERAREPGRYVFTSNLVVHRTIFTTVNFDEAFIGWGWEDVDWGLRVAERFAIRHIDNTATHLGLESDASLIKRSATSGANFARLVQKHPQAASSMALYRAARRLKPLAATGPLFRALALQRALPAPARVAALKVYRAMAYSAYLDRA